MMSKVTWGQKSSLSGAALSVSLMFWLHLDFFCDYKVHLGYKTHPKLSNLVKPSSQTENYMKITWKLHENTQLYKV